MRAKQPFWSQGQKWGVSHRKKKSSPIFLQAGKIHGNKGKIFRELLLIGCLRSDESQGSDLTSHSGTELVARRLSKWRWDVWWNETTVDTCAVHGCVNGANQCRLTRALLCSILFTWITPSHKVVNMSTISCVYTSNILLLLLELQNTFIVPMYCAELVSELTS